MGSTSKWWTVTGRGVALDLDALAREFVQTSAVDLEGADHRRHLQDRTRQVLGDDAREPGRA